MENEEEINRPIYGKVIIQGILECKTGLHIGSGIETMEIGALDNPVIRDPITDEPYVPGSSLKGKMRSLLERKLEKTPEPITKDISRHECNNNGCPLCRLFGATLKKDNLKNNVPSRLIVRDLRLTDDSKKLLEKITTGLKMTELKAENSIDRITSAAEPRTMERVPPGAEYIFELVYEVVKKDDELKEDIDNILDGLRILADDYIGGNGSRGYGKISFKNISVNVKPIKKDKKYTEIIPIQVNNDWANVSLEVLSNFS